MTFEILIAFIFASAVLSFAPGPDNIFVLSQSALYGRKSGFLITLGLCTGLIFHTTFVALGVATLIQTSPFAFNLLKATGALYLVYLAWQAFQAAKTDIHSNSTELGNFALYRRGVIMNLTNPKITLFFLAFLPQFTNPENGSVTLQIFILGGVFILVGFSIFSLIIMLAAKLGSWLKNSETAQKNLNRMAGMVFIGLAIHLVIN